MLFVAEYSVSWDGLEAAVAKRLEWGELKPETFKYLGEYTWHDGDPPFRGVTIFEAESVEDVHAFVLHYGPTIQLKVHSATDVMSGIQTLLESTGGGAPPA
jgi:hypothetical protein